jgi:hypothetical protein
MSDSGHYLPTPYKTASVLNLAFQIAALAWFVDCEGGQV